MPARRCRGFTLVECMLVCTVAAVLATLALPSYRGQQLRMARIDAVAALTRLQLAQERYRAATGLYAQDLASLGGLAAKSPQGRYALSVASLGPDGYLATAQAQGEQSADSDCAAITLEVSQGFAHNGPTPSCWNR
jgi:type IV pilus assembly protein PilE